MRNIALLAMLSILTSCGAATANEIDTSDDLHCSVIVHTLEMNAIKLNASPNDKKNLCALRSWFYSRISPKIAQDRLAEATSVVEILKRNPGELLVQYAEQCAQRAFRKTDFNRWADMVVKERVPCAEV